MDFGSLCVLFGVLMVLVLLFVPEAACRRDGVLLVPVEENSGDETQEGKMEGKIGTGEH